MTQDYQGVSEAVVDDEPEEADVPDPDGLTNVVTMPTLALDYALGDGTASSYGAIDVKTGWKAAG